MPVGGLVGRRKVMPSPDSVHVGYAECTLSGLDITCVLIAAKGPMILVTGSDESANPECAMRTFADFARK